MWFDDLTVPLLGISIKMRLPCSGGQLSREAKADNRALAKERIVIEHVNARLKVFRILAGRYRNRRRRFGLRCNLIAALYNQEYAKTAFAVCEI